MNDYMIPLSVVQRRYFFLLQTFHFRPQTLGLFVRYSSSSPYLVSILCLALRSYTFQFPSILAFPFSLLSINRSTAPMHSFAGGMAALPPRHAAREHRPSSLQHAILLLRATLQ